MPVGLYLLCGDAGVHCVRRERGFQTGERLGSRERARAMCPVLWVLHKDIRDNPEAHCCLVLAEAAGRYAGCGVGDGDPAKCP